MFQNLIAAIQQAIQPTETGGSLDFWRDFVLQYPSFAALFFIVWQLWKRLKQRDDKMEAVLDRYHQDVNSFKNILQTALDKLNEH